MPPPMRQKAGDKVHLLAVQKMLEASRDALNNPVYTPTTQVNRYAAIEGISGREIWQGQAVHADATHGITIWSYVDSVTGLALGPTFRFLGLYGQLKNRVFNILYVNNPGELYQGTDMYVQCKEEV